MSLWGLFGHCLEISPVSLEPRHSFCTRLLSSMMPANMYAKNKKTDKTMDSIQGFMSEDLTECFYEGVVEPLLEKLGNLLSIISHFQMWPPRSYIVGIDNGFTVVYTAVGVVSNLGTCSTWPRPRSFLVHICWYQRRLALASQMHVLVDRTYIEKNLSLMQ